MNSDTKVDAVQGLQKTAIIGLWTLGGFTLQDLSLIVAIGSGLVGILYGLIQTARLLRSWYLEEKREERRRHVEK